MEEPEGGLNFDFEGGLETLPSSHTTQSQTLNQNEPPGQIPNSNYLPGGVYPSATEPVLGGTGGGGGGGRGRNSYRQTVCRHWLRGLCMKGDACGFLHQYDKSRMPICRFFRMYGECREQDCVYKHTNEDVKECNMYKLGFCPNGPDCRYRHAKLPGPPPPVEEVYQRIQHLTSFNFNKPNNFFQNRNFQQTERFQVPQGPGVLNGLKHSIPAESLNVQQQQSHFQQPPEQLASQNQLQNLPNGPVSTMSSPLPQGLTRYFVVKSCNPENLELSVQQGVWATQKTNEAKLNEAFESTENVILIFSINRTRHFQGCGKMTSKIGEIAGGGNWKYAHGTAHYGRNFSVKWLKLCELSFHKTRHLRNPYNDNLPVKISRDCQEIEPSIGQQLASLLYLEPDSELMAISVAAETKRKEEKENGVNPEGGPENPDIVLFEDNDDEEEEESEEEDEGFGQQPYGRGGRGRGMWPPHMVPPYGGRPMPGVRGFPPGDGFGFPPVDGFGFPRAFPPYGPRFPGDFTGMGPNAGMGFRPGQPGPFFPPNMMMVPGRGPFMGGMGMVPGPGPFRGNRPGGFGQFGPPGPGQQQPPPAQRRQQNDRNERHSGGAPEQGRSQEVGSPGGGGGEEETTRYQSKDVFGAEDKSGESESEDEAPRRSRHVEGKKR
ncbi:30-kDa cleavage and polyadenylation specificity factor 30 [Ranunculus cassubicifolius]